MPLQFFPQPDQEEQAVRTSIKEFLDTNVRPTVREDDELVWLLYRENGETVEDMFALVFADDLLILARLEGDLNELMAKVVADHQIIPELFPGTE